MKSEGPGSPFCEPAGLLELVSTPCLLSDRRICVDASSCRHLMHSGEKKYGMRHSCEDSKENVHIKPLNKPKQLKAMKSDGNKKALGERDLNLGEDMASNIDDVVDTPPRTKNADIPTCASTGLSMESILEILDEDRDRLVSEACDVGLEDLPPYHPISAPFSPRPQFLRLKRPSGPSTRAEEELEGELPPYDPDLNPLSPRPRFLRYNPLKRMDFLRARLNDDIEISEGKSLDFSDKGIQDEFGDTVPSKGQTKVGLARSASCPELFGILAEENFPPLETSQNAPMKAPKDPEDDTESIKTAVNEEPIVARRFNRGAVFRRTLLWCLCLACIATSCFVVRENPSLLRSFQQLRFPAWEWTERDDQDVKYTGYSNTITAIANYSIFSMPDVDEEIVLSLSDAEDVLPKIGEEGAAVSDSVFVLDGIDGSSYLDDSPIADEDGSEECRRVDWKERILNICLDRAISLAELNVAAHGTEDSVLTSSSHIMETDWRLLDEATVTEDLEATIVSSLNEEMETSGTDSSTSVFLNTEEADHSQIARHTSVTQEFADSRMNLFDRLVAYLLGNFRLLGSYSKNLLSSFRDDNSLLRLSFVVCGVSLLIGAVTMFSRFRVEAPVRALLPNAAALTRAAPETTSETSDDSFSGSSSESTYGSFTKMEPMVLTRGQVTLTPVRRSSRIRSRILSPNLKA